VEEQGKVVDLMAALEASLARAGRGGDGEGEEELPPAATTKRAAKGAAKKSRARKSA
jgi:hypothetical protein